MSQGDTDRCPICAEPFKPDDLCASDVTEGTCHAACLEGSTIVDLETGEEEPDGVATTYRYSEVMEPDRRSSVDLEDFRAVLGEARDYINLICKSDDSVVAKHIEQVLNSPVSEAVEIERLRVELGAKDTEARGYLRTVSDLQDRLAKASPSPSPLNHVMPVVSVKTMRLGDGRADYFVSIKVGNREVTPHVFREEYKAAYHVALYSWLLNGTDKPDLMAFDEGDWPAQATETLADVEAEIASVVQSVNEWDDRTSPDDYPEHLLITSEELTLILRNFAAAISASEGSGHA